MLLMLVVVSPLSAQVSIYPREDIRWGTIAVLVCV